MNPFTSALAGAGTALALVVAGPPPARAAAPRPHVVVWSGARAPGSPATGLELRADGSARALSGDGRGTIRTTATFRPSPSVLAKIRRAADALLHGAAPLVTHEDEQDGGYVTVTVQEGATTREITDTGADPAAVSALLEPLNQALTAVPSAPGRSPADGAPSGLPAAGPRPHVHPQTAECPPGQQPTEVVKTLPLYEAIRARMARLSPKGAIGGDAIAVDAGWKDLVAPARITVHIEVQGETPGSNYAATVQAALARGYAGYVVDGQPVSFAFDVVNREAGAAPRPCYHEVFMHTLDDVRSYVTGEDPLVEPLASEWSAKDPQAWQHETAHMLGLDDMYDDWFHSDQTGADIKLPERGLEGAALQAALPTGVSARSGYVFAKTRPGYENDLIGGNPGGRLSVRDLGGVVARAGDLIVDEPGDILVSKNGQTQNFVTGAQFALPVPYQGTAHVDGLVAYCIDLLREPPSLGGAEFDDLGPAGSFGTPAMDALQRVVDVVAAREPGPLQETPGANDAIWRVTDDLGTIDGDDDDAASILQAAGVPAKADDQRFAAPHLDDPDAADPQSAALTPTGVAPPPDAPVEGTVAPPGDAPPQLTSLRLSTRHIRLRSRQSAAILGARVVLAGAGDQVSLRLTRRRGDRSVTVARGPATAVPAGGGPIALIVRSLRPGRYRVVAIGAHGGRLSRALTVTQDRAPRSTHHRSHR